MERIYTPWRSGYLAAGPPTGGCLFCGAGAAQDDRAALVLARGAGAFIMLNAFPYTSGHLMIVPRAHVAWPSEMAPEAHAEMNRHVVAAETALRRIYGPDGMNIGMNLGAEAGAGIPGHLHLHVVPRWRGDANFMTAIADTRVLPEDLAQTYERLHDPLSQALHQSDAR